MLTINKSSWHYWVYNSSYSVLMIRTPEETNLCAYVRRLVLAPFILILVGTTIPALLAIVCLFTLVMAIMRLPFGYYPTSIIDSNNFERYDGLQVGDPLTGWELYPYHAFPFIALGLLNWYLMKHHETTTAFNIDAIVILSVLGVVACIMHKHSTPSKSVNLLRGYIAAKKQKICPLVKFEGKGESV